MLKKETDRVCAEILQHSVGCRLRGWSKTTELGWLMWFILWKHPSVLWVLHINPLPYAGSVSSTGPWKRFSRSLLNEGLRACDLIPSGNG